MTQRNDIYECLPATPAEIASSLDIPLHTVHAVLCDLLADGLVVRTALFVRCAGSSKLSRLWSFSGDEPDEIESVDEDDNETGITPEDIRRVLCRSLLRKWRLAARKSRPVGHAFTHMGIAQADAPPRSGRGRAQS